MPIRSITFHAQFQYTACRLCGEHELYGDHDNHVWCNNCEGWNGWIEGDTWLQPGTVPTISPNGSPTLF